ncbi:MAG: hypothetical protein HC846_13550 [Blastocatellia bacterium]|nr:hypothetical protein [Blastocatellia bacterium]
MFLALFFSLNIFAQSQPIMVDVVSEEDATPGVVKALPEYEKVKDKAIHITNIAELKKASNGERGVLDLIDFKGGNEAAIADYESGKLLIVEFVSPQVSFETDNQIKERLNQTPVANLFYRRIGNYNVFLFDGKDEASADALLKQIKYQKTVKWLGEDPFQYNRAERHFVESTLQLFLSTILAIAVLGGIMLALGITAGIIYFRMSNKQREQMTAFSDAGGMIRLNLDELTPDVAPDRLLKG